MDALHAIYDALGRHVPPRLRGWERRLDEICDAYRARAADAEIVEVRLGERAYLFDVRHERLVCACGVSSTPVGARDSARMAGFPDPNAGWGKRGRRGSADRGHFIAHAAGGELDINLFPQARRLNRGWSPRGKVYREMERYAATHPGTFVFSQPIYGDDSWVPKELVYGILKEDTAWWEERFDNRGEIEPGRRAGSRTRRARGATARGKA